MTEQERRTIVEQWEVLYDGIYSGISSEGNIETNFSLWKNSHDGQSIPEPQMREWLRHTLKSIRDIGARRILEVGCGQGFLLMNLAEGCTRYAGVDFSSVVLFCLQEILEALPEERQAAFPVELIQSEAVELPDLGPAFELGVYNSIVQYFPDRHYLLRAVQAGEKCLESNGRMFFGDIRNQSGLELFHASVKLEQMPEATLLSDFLAAVRTRMAEESELLVAPAFWNSLGADVPRAVHADVSPKRGESNNELTRFRYDVTLYLDQPPAIVFNGPEILWGKLAWDTTSLDAVLRESPAGLGNEANGILVRGIPNARLSPFGKIFEVARRCAGQKGLDLAFAKEQAADELARFPRDRGLLPNELDALAGGNGLEAKILLEPQSGLLMDVIFHRPDSEAPYLPTVPGALGKVMTNR